MQLAEEEPSMAEQVSIVNSAKMFFCYFYFFWLDNGKNHLCFIVSDQAHLVHHFIFQSSNSSVSFYFLELLLNLTKTFINSIV
jgi:hypothetical protein